MEDDEEESPASKTLAASEVSHTHNHQPQTSGLSLLKPVQLITPTSPSLRQRN